MLLYHWSSCSACQSARRHLAKVDHEERDFFAHPLTRAELMELARLSGGMRNIFSFRSPSFKRLQLAPAEAADEKLLELVLTEPRLLRRPILVDGGRVRVGLKDILDLGGHQPRELGWQPSTDPLV